MEKLTGLIAAPFTPMDEDGAVALSQIPTLARLYERNGVNGAFICGTTGEGSALTHEEKKSVMQTWGREKGDHLKVIMMLGGNCLMEIKELAKLAEQNRMDGISILCPYFFKPSSVQKLVDYCKEVTSAAPNLPFYYYHIPAMTNGHFSMRKFLELADGVIPNLAGIKFSSYDLFDFQACTLFKNGKYNFLWGVDEALLSALVAGADGAVGSTYNYAAPLYVDILTSYEAGNIKEARALQLKSVQMVQLLVKYGGGGAGKAFMKLIDADCGWFRPPHSSLSDDELNILRQELEEIGFFDFCSK